MSDRADPVTIGAGVDGGAHVATPAPAPCITFASIEGKPTLTLDFSTSPPTVEVANDMSDGKNTAGLEPEAPAPWWSGTVIPTGQYRLKLDPWRRQHLQHLVTDTGGLRKRWTYIPTVATGTSDDEP